MRVAEAAYDIAPADLQCEISLLRTQRLQHCGTMLGGRMILWMIRNHFRLSDADALCMFVDLQYIVTRGDNLKKFKVEWQRILGL